MKGDHIKSLFSNLAQILRFKITFRKSEAMAVILYYSLGKLKTHVMLTLRWNTRIREIAKNTSPLV